MPIFVAVPGSHLKHKRNVKTREQYKRRKAQAHHVTIQVQEVERTGIKSYIVEKEASEHVVLQLGAWSMATSLHAVISRFGTSFIGTIMVQNGVIYMRRMGVG